MKGISRHHVWLETIINFLYFLQISPFRFTLNPSSGKYSLKTGTCSKVSTGIIHVLGVLITFFGLYNWSAAKGLKNPRCVFHVAVSYSRFIIYYALLFTLWCRRRHFEEFFTSTSYLSWTFTKDSMNSTSRAKWASRLMCSLMIPSAIGIEILNYSGAPGIYQYILTTFQKPTGPEEFGNLIGIHAQTKMITSPEQQPIPISGPMPPNFTFSHFPPPPPPHHGPHLSVWNIMFTLFFDIMKIYIRTCNHFALLFSILAAITFYQAAISFINAVSKEKNQDKAILRYIDFCKFGNCLNKMCGSIVLATVVCSPPFYIVYFIGTFSDFEYNAPRVIFYSVMYCCVYLIAAEASNKVAEFKEWIMEYGEGEEENECQLFAIFVEISENPVGLSGMRCFTITYGFLAKMFALIITFTIVLMQFETTPTNAITNIPCE